MANKSGTSNILFSMGNIIFWSGSESRFDEKLLVDGFVYLSYAESIAFQVVVIHGLLEVFIIQ